MQPPPPPSPKLHAVVALHFECRKGMALLESTEKKMGSLFYAVSTVFNIVKAYKPWLSLLPPGLLAKTLKLAMS